MKKDSADVIARPPVIYIIPIIIAYIINKYIFELKILNNKYIGDVVGWPLFIIGLFLAGWVSLIFFKEKEDVRPEKPTTKIIIKGPFKFSRNPIYLGLNLGYIGIALILNNLWMIVFLPIIFTLLYYGVILKEEEYLEKKFGKKYLDYKKKVRRWI